jgi:hypothetical protein
MEKSLLLVALFLFPSAFAARADDAPAGAETYDLKYKFIERESIRTQVTHKSTIRTTIRELSQDSESSAESEKVWGIKKVNADGSAVIVHMIASVDMRQAVKGSAPVRYNSKHDENPPEIYKEVATTIGKPLAEITLDPRGQVLNRRELLAGAHRGGGLVTVPLPGEPVPVGHVWNNDYAVPVLLKGGRTKDIQMRQRYELLLVKKNVATISVRSIIVTPNIPPEIEVQLVQRMSHGEVKFDLSAGRVVQQSMKVDGTVVQFQGAGSVMQCQIEFHEQLLDDARSARRQ